ncbi:response regulator transcription factor [Aquibacillus koreensis]|uniref:Response regulator transcription factor n=1 Tax=Aquibacillus koreensis TaxID=279446 RepID=A0A9X4ALD0_9BACI|nr:response regulator transcription factor [Aquibacillus koreensis]MCT2536998.1 response regulator transcription factor [Aquibacillus koreensis]MDC3422348.1 response regulator transcription factor [Aquibacillus koreensis]
MASEKIMLIDDDEDLKEVLRLYLEKNNYTVLTACDELDALAVLEQTPPDLIVLDVMMPHLDGFELCQLLRKKTEVPILFLSSKDDDMNAILGLGVGGDDYISKSTSPAVIMAKIKAHLRRMRVLPERQTTASSIPTIIKYPGLEINMDSAVVKVNGQHVNLAAKEFQILCLLAKNPERVYSIEKLFEMIWGEKSLGDNRTVMVHISNLRKKLESNPNSPVYIETVRGIGYKFHMFQESQC